MLASLEVDPSSFNLVQPACNPLSNECTLAAMDIALERRTAVLVGPSREPLFLKDLKVVCGTEFFRAHKGDCNLCRILVGKSWAKDRPIKHSDVFAKLQKLRNDAIESILNPPAQEDLGLDDGDEPRPKKKSKAELADLPEVVALELPAVGTAGGITIKVAAGSGNDPLWVELSAEVLKYLAAWTVHQIQNESVKPHKNAVKRLEHERVHLPDINGLSFDYGRQAYRARRNGKNKYFFMKSHDDACSAAVEWLQEELEGNV